MGGDSRPGVDLQGAAVRVALSEWVVQVVVAGHKTPRQWVEAVVVGYKTTQPADRWWGWRAGGCAATEGPALGRCSIGGTVPLETQATARAQQPTPVGLSL
eukprot:352450-Chlamydomonas_euryale.AAC.4